MKDIEKQDIRYLKGVGEKRGKLFNRLGIFSVGDLLRYYPRNYLDLGDCVPVSGAPLETPVLLRLSIIKKSVPVRLPGNRTMSRIEAEDESSGAGLIYFNNRFTPQSLKEGGSYLFYGKLKGSLLNPEMVNPQLIKERETEGLIPQYPATEGLPSRVIAGVIREALPQYSDSIEDTLPAGIKDRFGLISLYEALCIIHNPKDHSEAEQARRRLIFEELFTLQLGMMLFRERAKRTTGAVILNPDPERFISSLPFTLTDAQVTCIDEIIDDLKRDVPMSRLLQGDVGSGKTVVAAAAVYAAAVSGFQSAVMAPTEILAKQHANTFSALFEGFGIKTGLLTGSVKGKQRQLLLDKIKTGEVEVIIGTHALISEDVGYKKLGLVVADEQHRFGVEQRMRLSQKGDSPHLLVMSATPIPRTLALIIYGDLDISVIDRLPPGRKPVRTYLVDDSYRERYLNFIKKNADEGRQAYIVCPLIEESEIYGDHQAAVQYKQQLENGPLKGYTIEFIHGKMKSTQKQKIMDSFKNGELSVLVSTTVIEVGVDVPNANIMVVENAEFFGLSALHQLRGRIGRGTDEGYCVLVSGSENEITRRRLKIMTRTTDGFAVAKLDLSLRGPGNLFGKRQHGLPELKIADLVSDERILYETREAAETLAGDDRLLSGFPKLKAQIERLFEQGEGAFN